MHSRVGFLVSSFDLFNVSDLDLIAQARSLCDRLEVAVLSDDAIEQITGDRPVVPLSGRLALLSHVRGIDGVTIAEPSLPRFGAPDGVTVFATTIANGLGTSDVVLTSLRRSDSTFLRADGPAVREAVA